MARNRNDQDRESKRREILDAASLLFGRDGFEATSMAKLAGAASVTANTIYWYYDDKDAILLAVVESAFEQAAATYPAADLPTLADQLLWLADVFDGISGLTVAVHSRALVSEPVRTWHDAFHVTADAWLLRRARRHLTRYASEASPSPDEAALAAIPRLWSYAIEGMVTHRLPREERRALCLSMVGQLEALATPR